MSDPKTMPLDQLDRELQLKSRSVYANESSYTYSQRHFYLKSAIAKGDAPRVEVYLRCGASPDPMVVKLPDSGVSRTDWFPLEWAVMTHKVEMVELMLQFGADINATGLSTRRLTALRLAVENQDVPIVQKLLSVGACPESYQHHYGSAKERESLDSSIVCDLPVLYDAVKRNNVEIAEMLLHKGAKANLPKSYKLSYSYLTEAVRVESPAMVALLLQYGADANFQVPKMGTTPLMMAAKTKKNAIDMAKLLVQHGATVNTQELVHKRQDALTIAVLNQNPDLVRVLLQLGARPNAIELAPLFAASTVTSPTKASVVIINLLIDHGAEVDGCNSNGVEPLFAAVEKQNTAIVEALLKRGAKADVVHGDMTPLKQAVLKQDVKLGRLLVRHGACPTARVFAPTVINGRREICSSAQQVALSGGSSDTILAIFNDPHFGEPEPSPAREDEEKRSSAAPLLVLLSATMSRELSTSRLQPIGMSKETATPAVVGSCVEVKRTLARVMLCITSVLCDHAGRSLYCEWELVAPERDQPMASVVTSGYQPVQRERRDDGVIVARGKTGTGASPDSKASSTSPGRRTRVTEWHDDRFPLHVGAACDDRAQAKTMDQKNHCTLLSCELRFRVKAKGSLFSKTVGEAWFQLSQLDIGVPSGTTAKFLLELSHKNKRAGTMAFELTY